MKESVIEKALTATVRKMKGLCWKWTSTRRGVPDRIILFPVPPEHRDLVARYVRFAELKSNNGKLSTHQHHVHTLMRQIGFRVDTIWTSDQAHAYDKTIPEELSDDEVLL